MLPRALSHLTARELEVLRLIAEGRTIKEIVDLLAIAPSTAAAHRKACLRKLALTNDVLLAHYAIERGLVGRHSPHHDGLSMSIGAG